MTSFEQHRAFWAGIARMNGWYTQPFFMIAFVDEDGKIVDSVSHIGLDRDYVVPY